MGKFYKVIFLIFFISFVAGCAQKDQIVFEQPSIQIPSEPAKPPVRKKGSLYSVQGGSLFSDKKDLQIGDIIQVLISEQLQAETQNSRSTSRNTNNNLGGLSIAPNATNTNPSGVVSNVANALNNNLGFNAQFNSSASLAGTADSEIDETFETTISVIIEQTYQNGNYFIKGSKEMLIDGNKQEVIISGVIRPYDIAPENSIMSSQIANLKILYKKDGEERDALKTPWGKKILDALWPF